MRVVLEYGFEGPFREGYWTAMLSNGERKRITGKQASMISMILSGYVFQGNFQPADAFTADSLEEGRQLREMSSQ